MRTAALLFPALGALVLLPAVAARADSASCREELQQLAQTYHLSVSPPAQSAAPAQQTGSSEWSKVQGLLSQGQGAGGQGASRAAEPPATTESRGIAGPDSLESSGGTLPPSASAAARDRRDGAAPAQQLGAADRAKVEGLMSQGQAADRQGKGDQCLQALQEAREVLQKARQ